MEKQVCAARRELDSLETQRIRLARLRRNVEYLQGKCTDASSHYGVRISGTPRDKSDLWDELADRRQDLEDQQKLLREREERLEEWIDLLPKPRWRMVLRCRYLDGMELCDVARELEEATGRDISMHQVYRLHSAALRAADQIWPLS